MSRMSQFILAVQELESFNKTVQEIAAYLNVSEQLVKTILEDENLREFEHEY